MKGSDKSPASDSLCSKCSKFYGNPQNSNMCSSCYKEHLTKLIGPVKEEKKAVETAVAAPTKLEENKAKTEPEKPKQVT